jgi:hypothetical protein
VALTLVSFVSVTTVRLGAWRPEDYAAYKTVRLLGGRRIAGSVWLPLTPGSPQRISNAHRWKVVDWFVERAAPSLHPFRDRGRQVALVPYPDPGRIVGASPSRSRRIAQALSDSSGVRVLDVLRWRQRMPRCRVLEVQTLADNLLITGSVMHVECVVVAECVGHDAGLQAAAAQLRRHGGRATLAVSAARAVRIPEDDPFSTLVTEVEDVATVDL